MDHVGRVCVDNWPLWTRSVLTTAVMDEDFLTTTTSVSSLPSTNMLLGKSKMTNHISRTDVGISTSILVIFWRSWHVFYRSFYPNRPKVEIRQTFSLLIRPRQGISGVLCLSVCLSTHTYLRNHASELHQIFRTFCLCPWLGPPLAAWPYVIHFRFCGRVIFVHNDEWCATRKQTLSDSPGGSTAGQSLMSTIALFELSISTVCCPRSMN